MVKIKTAYRLTKDNCRGFLKFSGILNLFTIVGIDILLVFYLMFEKVNYYASEVLIQAIVALVIIFLISEIVEVSFIFAKFILFYLSLKKGEF